ncbi:MAG: hypothetical protein EG825_00270 [Rhodocyclaceae bacterium]|nr:hypothetical protein [Rhodocyclaceae bacterium]
MSKRYKTSADSPSMLRIVAALEKHGPMDKYGIADKAFVTALYFQNQCRYILKDAGRIHVHGWIHNISGQPRPVYAAGPGEDAPRPGNLDQLARARKWKERTGYHDLQKSNRRLARLSASPLCAVLGMQP